MRWCRSQKPAKSAASVFPIATGCHRARAKYNAEYTFWFSVQTCRRRRSFDRQTQIPACPKTDDLRPSGLVTPPCVPLAFPCRRLTSPIACCAAALPTAKPKKSINATTISLCNIGFRSENHRTNSDTIRVYATLSVDERTLTSCLVSGNNLEFSCAASWP
jgi:hypothetical protein